MTTTGTDIKTLYDAGLHVGYSRTRRHPSAVPYLFGTKDRVDVFDLERTQKHMDAALAFVLSVAQSNKHLLFIGGKPESAVALRAAAERAEMPYVASRWIGGTLTNFKNIRKRIERLLKLTEERESGELAKYTKRERLLLDREAEKLRARFGGLIPMVDLPAAVFVVDTKYEHTAVCEANHLGIPVVGLLSSDCDFSLIQYPIPANDTSVKSVRLVCDRVAEACIEGKEHQMNAKIPSTKHQITNNI
ncbi:30S ribosomal protein S2 [Candidatus Kaiserbacteria bacterium RIFCSPLOWO2_02_FULL_51_13]|uniref:Small ribosomal subunit protein uS2 n=1 Tax=Candidatus Kaiserbacteria bacterium RIFCSPLOWO2_01_FULL_50_24 TaxID=1798507 RepID=A0A1F6EMN0_9BACT|nr:MAG: 30S ribosomal protein S2 [Candidatus Kaiserbacteria bacterium RIFCSPLOWO2_01_FULL_50_24]OGG81630.1 MAG: 30S ribosomal protein S2 [Candidatus Kaiserbacteria bacterium RIFCSPLOWO2_02_FULL_51_13]